jgi:hypothetical protein
VTPEREIAEEAVLVLRRWSVNTASDIEAAVQQLEHFIQRNFTVAKKHD